MERVRKRLGERGRERERDRFLTHLLDPSPFTEGLYEARSLPVSALKLQIPPRFVDRMAVSYSCKEKLHSAASVLKHTHAHTHTHTLTHKRTHSHTFAHTLGRTHPRTDAHSVLTHLSFRGRKLRNLCCYFWGGDEDRYETKKENTFTGYLSRESNLLSYANYANQSCHCLLEVCNVN